MEQQCVLSPTAAYLTAFVIAAAYVASLYLLPRRIRKLHRDDSRHIYGRFVAVAVSSIFAVALYARVGDPRCLGVDGVAAALGLRAVGAAAAAARAAACVALLYLGTLAERCALGGFTMPDFGAREWRNLVVGPLSEELCFRACVLPLLVEAVIGRWRAVWTSPLVFGLAHVHHAHRRVADDGISLSHALIETAFQLMYTTLFGAFAAYAFFRTHRLSAPVAAHMLCNYLGLPGFECFSGPVPAEMQIDPDERRRRAVFYDYRAVLIVLHVAGVYLFFTRSASLFPAEGALWY